MKVKNFAGFMKTRKINESNEYDGHSEDEMESGYYGANPEDEEESEEGEEGEEAEEGEAEPAA